MQFSSKKMLMLLKYLSGATSMQKATLDIDGRNSESKLAPHKWIKRAPLALVAHARFGKYMDVCQRAFELPAADAILALA